MVNALDMKLEMKLNLNQNIGMSVNITVVDTVQKMKKIKLLNNKIENEVCENHIEVKTKYLRKCLHCSHRHSTKMK